MILSYRSSDFNGCNISISFFSCSFNTSNNLKRNIRYHFYVLPFIFKIALFSDDIKVHTSCCHVVNSMSFAMEFVPGKGTTFYILGKPQGAPVGDDEFFQMVMRIWVGDSPADSQLRDALLGLGRE